MQKKYQMNKKQKNKIKIVIKTNFITYNAVQHSKAN